MTTKNITQHALPTAGWFGSDRSAGDTRRRTPLGSFGRSLAAIWRDTQLAGERVVELQQPWRGDRIR